MTPSPPVSYILASHEMHVSAHHPSFAILSADVPASPLWQDKSPFWKRKSSIVKAHMLLLVHLGREEIPDSLAADHKYVITKAALLCEEMVKIASLPRPPNGLGWLAPIVGSVEMMQCLTQGVPIASRKALGQSGKVRTMHTLASYVPEATDLEGQLWHAEVAVACKLVGHEQHSRCNCSGMSLAAAVSCTLLKFEAVLQKSHGGRAAGHAHMPSLL